MQSDETRFNLSYDWKKNILTDWAPWTYISVKLYSFLSAFKVYISLAGGQLDGPGVSAFGVRSLKLSNIGRWSDEWPKIYYLEHFRASEGRLSRWPRLHLQSLAPANPHLTLIIMITISLLMSPLLGHRPSFCITHMRRTAITHHAGPVRVAGCALGQRGGLCLVPLVSNP
jgi:hypothetical protein